MVHCITLVSAWTALKRNTSHITGSPQAQGITSVLSIFGSLPRYYLKATLEKKSGGQMIEEQEFILHVPVTTAVASNPISLQLRIVDYLILRVDFAKRDFYLDEYVVGKITVEKNSMEIQKVQIRLVKKEIVNLSGSNKDSFWLRNLLCRVTYYS